VPLTFLSSGSSAGLSSRGVSKHTQHRSSSRNQGDEHTSRLAGKAGICKAARQVLINLEQQQTVLGDAPRAPFQERRQQTSTVGDQRRAARPYPRCCSAAVQRQRWVRANGLQACLLPGGYK